MAIARSADQSIAGIGTACGGTGPYDSRVEALASCIVASNALCRTDLTLDARGTAQSKDRNAGFDLSLYTQVLLTERGYTLGTVDGNFGSASTQALEAFETDLGLQPDGIPSDRIVQSLLAVTGGVGSFVQVVQQHFVASRTAQTAARTYGSAVAPSRVGSLADELAAASADQQRLAVASILSMQKTRCTIPANDATLVPGSGGSAWNVTCAEGQYTLMLGNDGSTIIAPGTASVAPAQADAQPVAGASSVAPASAAAAAPSSDGMAPPMQAQAPAATAPQQKVNVFVSGAGLQSTCPTTSPNNIACIAYVQGVVDAFVTIAASDGTTFGFCLPDGETGPQLAQIVDDYLTSHPELKEVGGAGVIQQALSEKLPCKPQ